MRWVDGRPWEETPLYQGYIEKIKSGKASHNAPTRIDLDLRYERLDRIFKAVRKDKVMSPSINNLVTISLARDGAVFWGPDGRHRVTIALIAGLKLMPVRVGFIHPQAIDHFQSMREFST